MEAQKNSVDSIIGRSLLTAETFSAELRALLVGKVSRLFGKALEQEIVAAARKILERFEPILVQGMADAEVAAWVTGVDSVVRILPAPALSALEGSAGVFVPSISSGVGVVQSIAAESVISFPLIEKAAESLIDRNIMTRAAFDAVSDDAKARSFTVAFQDSEDVISTIRDVLVETTEEGASLGTFKSKLSEALEGSRIGPAHSELVYRVNIQAAFHEAHDTMASNPVVEEVFPYQEYLPISDGRVRDTHLALGKLGLNGSGVYRRDDPMWEKFTPPHDFQCRCGVNLLTVEAAARKGVAEAAKWDRTGEPPDVPEWRDEFIPFEPNPDFVGGRAGR